MAFVDEIKLHLEAGRGGDGVVRWRQEKFIPKGGPAGGDGGAGGNVYARAVRDIHILAKYKAKKSFQAPAGDAGGAKSLHGAAGADLFLDFPVGSLITNIETGEKWELRNENEEIILLKGGRGGWGNEHFKSSINTTPREWRPGLEGESGNFLIELELFADVGLVGLPNAGKSSLLNALTNAQAKVGDYAFTTLDPNLGDFYGYIIADIPGLIEGASEGKGLGVKFLRHIKRTKMLAHLVSFENENIYPVRSKVSKKPVSSNGMMKVYKEVRKELKKYGQGLEDKEEIIILTKTDVVEDPKIIKKRIAEFRKLKRGKKVFTLSLYDDALIKNFTKSLSQILKKK